jgi:N6-adenosine-specific RNA methylase IME4
MATLALQSFERASVARPPTVRPCIDKEFKALIPPSKPEEKLQLEENLKQQGCRDALVVWRDPAVKNSPAILLDGHNRLELCVKNNLPFKLQEIRLEEVFGEEGTPEEFRRNPREWAKIWIRDNQLGRRNLDDNQRAVLALDSAAALTKLSTRARAQHAALVRFGKKQKKTGREKLGHEQRILYQLAKKANLRPKMLRKLQEIGKFLNRYPKYRRRKLIEKIRAGKLTVAQAWNTMQHLKIKEVQGQKIKYQLSQGDTNKYDVIIITPPWARLLRKCEAFQPFEPMQVDEINEQMQKVIDRNTPDDCHVLIWTPQQRLGSVFTMIKSCGLIYQCVFVWLKEGGEQPAQMPQYDCEFCVYAQKGQPKFIDTKTFRTCFTAERDRLLQKPRSFFQDIAKRTQGQRLWLYAPTQLDGYESWGNQATNSVSSTGG